MEVSMKQDIKTILLDGAAYKVVKPVSTTTITTAAEAADALAIVIGEYIEAKSALNAAEVKAAKIGLKSVTAMKAEASRLREEASKRSAVCTSYSQSVCDKCFEVAKIHKGLNGDFVPLRIYATGEIEITRPVTYPTPCGARVFAPEITDECRAAIDSFKPVLHGVPDTSAIVVRPLAAIVALRELATARARYETANQALVAALDIYDDCHDALDAEAKTEAASVEAAVAVQNKRNAM